MKAYSIAQEHLQAVEPSGWETTVSRYRHQERGGNNGSSHFIR
jgi:hypothetical protein